MASVDSAKTTSVCGSMRSKPIDVVDEQLGEHVNATPPTAAPKIVSARRVSASYLVGRATGTGSRSQTRAPARSRYKIERLILIFASQGGGLKSIGRILGGMAHCPDCGSSIESFPDEVEIVNIGNIAASMYACSACGAVLGLAA